MFSVMGPAFFLFDLRGAAKQMRSSFNPVVAGKQGGTRSVGGGAPGVLGGGSALGRSR